MLEDRAVRRLGSTRPDATSLDTGLTIAEEVGLRAEEAHLRLARARLLQQQGDPARASADRERARALLAATDTE